MLVQREDRGKPFFLKLQSHPLEHVRISAACDLLPLDQKTALRTLMQIAEHGEWEASLSAETAIAEWKAGRFDPHWFLREDTKKLAVTAAARCTVFRRAGPLRGPFV